MGTIHGRMTSSSNSKFPGPDIKVQGLCSIFSERLHNYHSGNSEIFLYLEGSH